MGNIFDSLGKAVFNTCNKTFGYPVSWQPVAGGAPLLADVLFGDPTKVTKIDEADFNNNQPWFEYKEGDLQGLFQSVNNGTTETVTVDGTAYYVRSIKRDFDGKCFKAFIENV